MSAFGTYLLGYIVFIIGLAAAAWLVGAPPIWILIGAVILFGLGVIMATSRTRPRDPPAA